MCNILLLKCNVFFPPSMGISTSAELIRLIGTSIGFLENLLLHGNICAVIGSWKHLCSDQVVQSSQLNHALGQMNEQVISCSLGTPVSGFVDE